MTQIELSYNVLRNLRICVHTHETYFRQDAEVRSQFEDERKATSEYKQVQYECQSLPKNYLDVLCNHYPFGLSTARTILQAALFRFVSKGRWVTYSTWAVINIWHFSGLGSLLQISFRFSAVLFYNTNVEFGYTALTRSRHRIDQLEIICKSLRRCGFRNCNLLLYCTLSLVEFLDYYILVPDSYACLSLPDGNYFHRNLDFGDPRCTFLMCSNHRTIVHVGYIYKFYE